MTLDRFDRRHIDDTVKQAETRLQSGLTQLQKDMKKADGNQQQMLEAFNRVAAVLEDLTDEIRALRRDLNPELNKPVKLATPKGTTP